METVCIRNCAFLLTFSVGYSNTVWPLYDYKSNQRLILDVTLSVTQTYKEEQCAFWEGFYP